MRHFGRKSHVGAADGLALLVAARVARDPQCRIHIADSQSAGLLPADADTTGPSGDWINEIHPTREGYRKAASAWEKVLDPILG